MLNKEKLMEAMGELDEDTVIEILNGVMAEGGAEAPAAMEACQKGMDTVGDLFEKGEYFVGDLIFAGELMQQSVDILRDALVGKDSAAAGKMLMCTVAGDLHDIGKNIVIAMLEASGFEVTDLGIDVPADKIVEAVKAENIKIVALSGVLTLAIDSMKATVDALKAAGLDDVKVIIGGAPITAGTIDIVGADAWGKNPQDTVKICKEWAAA